MGPSDLDDLYDVRILDHSRDPRHAERIGAPDAEGSAVNPFCGDEAHIQLTLEEGRVSGIGVQSVGCSINRASASMLSESVLGMSSDEAAEVDRRFRRLMDGDALSADESDSLADLAALDGVRAFPVRIKCALLPWTALEEAFEGFRRMTGAA